MAKDLKAFMKKASEDKGLAKKVSKAKNEQELRSIMASEGFELTDSDINDVSGGLFEPLVGLDNVTATIGDILSWTKYESNVKANINTGGANNQVGTNITSNFGSKK